MFLRNLQIYSIFLSLTVVLGCNGTGTLSVASDEFCPDYDVNSDVCQMQSFQSGTGEKDLLLEFMVPKETTLSTWKEWNHFIYFESPITVGYLLRWNRNASLDERTELRQDLHCSYSMRHPVSGVEVQGELEGKIREGKDSTRETKGFMERPVIRIIAISPGLCFSAGDGTYHCGFQKLKDFCLLYGHIAEAQLPELRLASPYR